MKQPIYQYRGKVTYLYDTPNPIAERIANHKRMAALTLLCALATISNDRLVSTLLKWSGGGGNKD